MSLNKEEYDEIYASINLSDDEFRAILERIKKKHLIEIFQILELKKSCISKNVSDMYKERYKIDYEMWYSKKQQ